MKKPTLLFLASLIALVVLAQEVYLGEPKTLLSYHKEHEVWKGNVRSEAKSTVNVKFEIFLSDSFVSITEPDTAYEFVVDNFIKDRYGNYTFFDKEKNRVKYLRTKSIISILWKQNTKIDTYYL